MAQELTDRETIRKYLLAELAEPQRQALEERLVLDDAVFEELQIVEDELIDDYLLNELNGSEKAQFETVFLATAERQDKLRFGRNFIHYVSSQTSQKKVIAKVDRPSEMWRGQLFASPMRIAVYALVVVGLAVGTWLAFFRQSDVDRALLALNVALREQRPFEARLTQLQHSPFSTTRGPGLDGINEVELRRAELILLEAVKKNPTPDVHHTLGKVYLAQRRYDEGIAELDKALKGDPNNALIYADLGAVWLEKGRHSLDEAKGNPTSSELGKGIEGLSRGLENLNKALELKPDLLEARFNRALCLEYQNLNLRAEEEWNEYLRRDSNSLWADEARRHLHLLEQRKAATSQTKENLLNNFLKAYEDRDNETAWLIIRNHRDVSGGPIENTLIDNYLQSTIMGRRAESLKALAILTYVGELESDRAGDLYLQDLVRFMRSLADSQTKSLVGARALLKAGRESLIQSNPEQAAEYYEKAKKSFEEIGDAGEALYAVYPLGHAYLLQLKPEMGLATFQQVVQQAELRQYKWLLAQALNAVANAQIGLTRYSAALASSHRSLEISQGIGDTTGEVKTTNQLAQQYFYLGNYTKSLALHERGLELAKLNVLEPMQVWRNYFSIALPLNAIGLPGAAIEYETEALRTAEKMKAPHAICRSHTILGLMYAGRGDYEAAVREVDIAIELGKQIASDTSQKESIAYSSLQLGHLYRQAGDFNKSIENYDYAIKLYASLENYQAFSYLAHKGKLLSCMRQEGCPSVDEEIKICLQLFEDYRLRILELSNRESFFDREQTIYDVAIGHEFSRSNFATALEYSERARSRSLLDSVSNQSTSVGGAVEPDVRFSSATAALRFQEIKARVPPKTQILQYAILEDRLLIWLISDTNFVHAEKAISLADLTERLLTYLKRISVPSVSEMEEITRESVELYDILIKPVETSLQKNSLLCVVPDKVLNYLPFGALVFPHSRKYLLDEYRVISAPSSSMFIHSSDVAGQQKTGVRSERLLAVGNPRFSQQLFPFLPDLPSAVKEAQDISTYYGKSSRILVSESATKQQVNAEMKGSDVIHLAMHSIVDEESPLRSKLIFANDARRESVKEDDSVLYAYEIYGPSLPRARLVVLSACETGVGRYYRGEGMMALSRTFIAAGVPLVVASLWRVDSDATTDLMIAFHNYRINEDLSSAEALQKAQLLLANGSDRRYRHPYYWAAFALVGGLAKF